MEDTSLDYILQEIKERIKAPGKEVIIDISVFPELNKMVEVGRIDFKPVYYISDTIYKLFTKAEVDVQYYQFISDLIRKWTMRTVDFRLLSKISREKEISGIRVLDKTFLTNENKLPTWDENPKKKLLDGLLQKN